MKRNVLEMGTSLWEYLVEGGIEDKWAVLVALLVGGGGWRAAEKLCPFTRLSAVHFCY